MTSIYLKWRESVRDRLRFYAIAAPRTLRKI
jgi:hypothetical protein